MRMLSVDLSDELHLQVRHRAVDEETSLRDIVQRALCLYLAECKRESQSTIGGK